MPTNAATLRPHSSPRVESEPHLEKMPLSPMSARHIPELDGLRGLAILLVLIWHFGYNSNSAGGVRWLSRVMDLSWLTWSGVDLFFVLSGFLIGGILLDVRDSANYFKAFYARRVFRILPIYVAVVGIFYLCVAAQLPMRHAGSEWLFGPKVPWYEYATFTQNFGFSAGVPNLAYWLAASWSLAVEEQFYLVLPAIIWIVPRQKLPYVLGGAILAAPLLRLFLNFRHKGLMVAAFTLMPCRADGLLLGVVAALLVRHAPFWERLKDGRRWLVATWVVLLLGLSLAIVFKQANPLESFWMSTFGLSWLALFYLNMLFLGLIYSGGWLGGILRASSLRRLGTISYGVYLLHWPVLGLTFMIFRSKRPWAETLAEHLLVLLAAALTIAVAFISWTFFEKPLLKIGRAVKY
jgi:peptidoglycan/LPS O-acetylase OafA/YrhL